MDVALRVVESVTMMHNGRIFKEGNAAGDRVRPRGAGALSRGRPWLSPRRPRPSSKFAASTSITAARTRCRASISRSNIGVLSVVGRNGMGKTTLCKTIMGLVRASGGSVRMRGEDITNLAAARRSRALGIGYVPQGRRLWRSLTVDEHLRMTAGLRRGAWTVERIYQTFPRLAERKNNGGGQLSGGEQQMLAISRALLTNPHLLVMDEPTEGLAPVIVAQVEEMLVRLGEEGDIAVLVDRAEYRRRDGGLRTCRDHGQRPRQSHHRIRAAGRRPRTAAAPARRRPPFRRRAEAEAKTTPRRRAAGAVRARRRRARGADPRSMSPIPTPPTRWSQPVPIARIEAAARTLSSRRRLGSRRRAPRREAGRGAQLRTADRARRRHARHQGRGAAVHPRHHRRRRLAHASRRRLDQRQALDLRTSRRRRSRSTTGAAARRCSARDRGASVTAMAEAFARLDAPPGRRRRRSSAPAVRAAPRSSRRACARCRSACRR